MGWLDKGLNEITADVIDAALEIHRKIGPGLLESVYELVLVAELRRRGHEVRSQVPISFEYNGQKIENAFRIDVFVDGDVVVELKSTESASPVHSKQLKTYLVLTGKSVGLLLNFGMDLMKTGIRRVVVGNAPDLCDSASPCETNIERKTKHDYQGV